MGERRLGNRPVDDFSRERAEPIGAARIDPGSQFRLEATVRMGAA